MGFSLDKTGDVLAKLAEAGIHTVHELKTLVDMDKSTDKISKGFLKDAGLTLIHIALIHKFFDGAPLFKGSSSSS